MLWARLSGFVPELISIVRQPMLFYSVNLGTWSSSDEHRAVAAGARRRVEEEAVGVELANEQIAGAFSHHDFEAAYPYLADDIRWNIVGERLVEGKERVIAVCRESAAYLTDVTTDFVKFRTVATDDCIVIDSIAEYTDKEKETSHIASCDIYDFTNGKVTQITSYTVEVGAH
jgi:limonene-1,2-epoxide hydrolase